MMEKRITAKVEKTLNKTAEAAQPAPVVPITDFPMHTQFVFNEHVWEVMETKPDGPVQWRRIVNKVGEQQWQTLHSLRKDAKSPGFGFIA
jgi:hypothetical protein